MDYAQHRTTTSLCWRRRHPPDYLRPGCPAADGIAALGDPRPLQDAVTQLTSPAQLSATSLTDSAGGLLRSLLTLRTLQQDAAALAVRNLQLEAQIDSLREVETENEQLRAMLNFAQVRPRLELRGAQIVARKIGEESTNFLDTILIDLGRAHGIEIGMPVVTDQGLVGRISEVTDSVSKVLLLTDPSGSASALLADSRLNGVVRGSSSGDLVMDFIPQGPTFEVGEVVLAPGWAASSPRHRHRHYRKHRVAAKRRVPDGHRTPGGRLRQPRNGHGHHQFRAERVAAGSVLVQPLPDTTPTPEQPAGRQASNNQAKARCRGRSRRPTRESWVTLLRHDSAVAPHVPAPVHCGRAPCRSAPSSPTWYSCWSSSAHCCTARGRAFCGPLLAVWALISSAAARWERRAWPSWRRQPS